MYASYAAVFLLKLVSPTFASFIDEEAAMKLVRDTADVLEKSAVDEQHTPALCTPLPHSRCVSVIDVSPPLIADGSFLRALIDNKLNGSRTAANSRAPTRPGSPNQNAGPFPHPVNGANGLDSYLHSRANSVGPEGLSPAAPNFVGDLPTFTPGGSFNFSGHGHGHGHGDGVVEEGTAHDAFTVDTMLQEGGFWSQMLMPGFGEGFAEFKLSGGTGTYVADLRRYRSRAVN